MRGRAVGRDAEHHHTFFHEFLPRIAKAARFLRTTRRVVLRIEIENHVLAGEVLERDVPTVRILQGERRSRFAFFERHHRPSTSSLYRFAALVSPSVPAYLGAMLKLYHAPLTRSVRIYW